MKVRAPNSTLDTAVCTCGHYLTDHRCANLNYQTGRITLAECLSSTCPCAVYAPDRSR
jgi:hypothetical protein